MIHEYDAVVIGSGHNALVSAAYLTRAGWSVLVLESNDRPGGLVRTEELTLPGFKQDVYSAAHPLFITGPAFADFGKELSANGLTYINTDLPTGVSLPDGRTAVFARTVEANVAELERVEPGDGKAFAEMLDEFSPYVNDVFSLFSLELASGQGKETFDRLMSDGRFTSLLYRSPRVEVSRFKSPVSRAMLAPWAMHLGRTPDEVGGGIWVPLVVLALMGGGMPIPAGGSEQLALAFSKIIRARGGTIQTGVKATQIVVKGGKAVAVRTTGGDITVRRAVVASVNPDQLYLKLLSDASIDAPVRKEADNFRYGRGCVQINLALSEPPKWRAGRSLRRRARSGAELHAAAVARPRVASIRRAECLYARRGHVAWSRHQWRVRLHRRAESADMKRPR